MQPAEGVISAPDYHHIGGSAIPKGKHLKGVGENEQRMYEHIVDEAKDDHRYGKRAEEVAARTVLKRHTEEHHKKGQ